MSVMEVWEILADEEKQEIIHQLGREYLSMINEKVSYDSQKAPQAEQTDSGNTNIPVST